jgi:hypothetical protein
MAHAPKTALSSIRCLAFRPFFPRSFSLYESSGSVQIRKHNPTILKFSMPLRIVMLACGANMGSQWNRPSHSRAWVHSAPVPWPVILFALVKDRSVSIWTVQSTVAVLAWPCLPGHLTPHFRIQRRLFLSWADVLCSERFLKPGSRPFAPS